MAREKTLAIIGECAPISVIEALKSKNFDVTVLPRDERLPSPVSSHSDMLLFCADHKVFISKDYALANRSVLENIESREYSVELCDCQPKNKYPHDVLFNIAKVGKNIFANMRYIDKTVASYLADNEYSLNHVNQGYAKCSTVVISNNAIITADTSIAHAAATRGIDVLLINNSPEAVCLDGYDYGFLGGACGLFENTLYICGNILLHPDQNRILDFCKHRDISIVSLTNEKIYDVGGIFFFN